MKKIISFLCIANILCLCLTGCNEEKKAAIADFETTVQTVEQKNTEFDTAIFSAENIIAEGKTALDKSLTPALETAISEAKAAKITIPEQSKKIEEIIAATEELNAVDYSEVLTNLSEKQSVLERSIQRYSLVDNPTETYIFECLKKVPNIVDISAVTEDNDPNGNLNKAGGYTAQVYFSSDLIIQSKIDGTSVIDKGTDCGGSIEVYTTVEYATNRNDYLASFDGGIFASGSHTVIGTVLVRTSNKLTASKQKALEANIIAALTDDEKSITDALEPVKQTSTTTNSTTLSEKSEFSSPESTSVPSIAGIYQSGNEALYFNNDGTLAQICSENDDDGYGNWTQNGNVVKFTIDWNGHEGGPLQETCTIVDGGIMWDAYFYAKVGSEFSSPESTSVPSIVGIYQSGNEALYFNSDGTLAQICSENDDDGYGNWTQNGNVVKFTIDWNGHEGGPLQETCTIVDGGIMWGAYFYAKVS